MKKLLFVLLAILLVGCTTNREVYYIAAKECDIPEKESVNRFKVSFTKADSAFTQKLREASKEAVRKTNIQLYGKSH